VWDITRVAAPQRVRSAHQSASAIAAVAAASFASRGGSCHQSGSGSPIANGSKFHPARRIIRPTHDVVTPY
jgi:hypothetical protein